MFVSFVHNPILCAYENTRLIRYTQTNKYVFSNYINVILNCFRLQFGIVLLYESFSECLYFGGETGKFIGTIGTNGIETEHITSCLLTPASTEQSLFI